MSWLLVLVILLVYMVVTNAQREFEGRRYIYMQGLLKFADAEKRCKNINSIIAPARTKQENNFLRDYRNSLEKGKQRMWIGGSDRNRTDGEYFWLDGSPLQYTNWRPGEPKNAGGKEDCMVMEAEFVSPNGQWNDIDCNMFKHQYICMQFPVHNTPEVLNQDCCASEMSLSLIAWNPNYVQCMRQRKVKWGWVNCSGERSFSALSRIKSKLRNRLGDAKLNNLTISCIEHEIVMELGLDSIVDEFADLKNRRRKI